MNLSRVLNHPKTGLNLEKLNIKWNQTYLSRGLNLNRRSNSLNSATGSSIDEFYQNFGMIR